MRYLYSYFCEMFSGDRLTYTEIKNYSEMKCLNLSPTEVEIIKMIEEKMA